MKEATWLKCQVPAKMLDFLRPEPDSRKVLLFSVACCQMVSDLLTTQAARKALETAERLAEGRVTKKMRRLTCRNVRVSTDRMWRYNWRTQESSQQDKIKKRQAILSATAAASLLLHEPHDIYAAFLIADRIASAQRARNRSTLAVERVIQADFVRDIFGNPFRPVTFDPRWRTSDVVGLARAIYDDKAFERIPILADALMDAGCEEEQIIGHCRGDGPHVRGCWVVDLVLGKE